MNVQRVLLLLSAATFSALPQSAPKASATPRIEFEKFTLPNGLQVILHVDRKLPMVHVNQWFHVGASREKPGHTGLAHLFEHMMFEGSKNSPTSFFQMAEELGADVRSGGLNAYTGGDRTNYFATVPSGNLERLLWLESDRLATLPDVLTTEKLRKNVGVVMNEKRAVYGRPYGKFPSLLFENLFPYGHPYAHDTIGTDADLMAASLDDVKEFFRTWYVPNNLSLAITGDFDPAEARNWVTKYFGPIPPGTPIDRPVKGTVRLDSHRIVEAKDRIPQARVSIAWPAPAIFDQDDAELSLAAQILADGSFSRFYKALVIDKNLCSAVTTQSFALELGSVFVVHATPREQVSLPTIESVIAEEVKRLAREGPSAAELEKARATWNYGFISALERIGGNGGKADRLNEYNTFLGDPGKFDFDLSRHGSVTTESLRQAVHRWLDTENRLIVRFQPEQTRVSGGESLDRSKQPSSRPDRPLQVPAVKSSRLPNGMEVLVVERHDLPKVSVTFVTGAGAGREEPGQEGLADLVAKAVTFGTSKRNAMETEQALGLHGTRMGYSAKSEYIEEWIDVLRDHLEPAMAVFADTVKNPSFPEPELARERNIRMEQIGQEISDPQRLISRIGPLLTFGRQHPYARVISGLRSSVQALQRKDFVDFHASYWTPTRSAIVFAGDITAREAVELAAQHFGDWAAGSLSDRRIPEPSPAVAGKLYVINKPGVAQTTIAQLITGPSPSSSEYGAAQLVNAIWAGAATSRLNLNLRESKGYSYGFSSFLMPRRNASVWMAVGAVQADKTLEALQELRRELEGVAGVKPITPKELDVAKRLHIRNYGLQFESLGSGLTERIIELWGAGLPPTDLSSQVNTVQAVGLSRVNEVAQKYISPSKVTFLLVCDWNKVVDGLRALGMGDVVLLDEQGQPADPVRN